MKLRIGRSEILLVVSIVFLVVAEQVALKSPALESVTMRIVNTTNTWATQYGYWGAFLVSCFGNITFVLVFPYTIVILFLASIGLNPIVLGLATGLGAELGEMSGYLLGRSGARVFTRLKPGAIDDVRILLSRRPRLVPWVIFLTSLLPVPADIIFIPLGILRYDWWKLAWPSTLGKVAAGLVIAYVGHSFFQQLQSSNYAASLHLALGTFIIVVVMLYVMAKAPWRLLVERTAGIKPVTTTGV